MTSEFFLCNFIKSIKWTNPSKKDEILLSPYNGRIHPLRME